jgi:hypothetical protein
VHIARERLALNECRQEYFLGQVTQTVIAKDTSAMKGTEEIDHLLPALEAEVSR